MRLCVFVDKLHWIYIDVTGPPGALSFDVKPEIAQEKSLELQFQVYCCLGIYCTIFPVVSG